MDDETNPSGTTETPNPPVSTASATGSTQVPDQSDKIVSNIKDKVCHDNQDLSKKQIELEQEIHDTKTEKQRLMDIANKKKQQQAIAEANRIRDEKIEQTKLHAAYIAMPRSTKDIVLKILSDNNLTVMTANNECLEMAITSAEIAAEVSEQNVKDELKKRGIPLFPSGSPNHTSQANTSTTPAISSAISSTQGIPIYTSSGTGFNLIPPHSSPNRILVTHPQSPPTSPPPIHHTLSHSTPDPNATVKTPVELEVERILNESRRQLLSDNNLNLNLKPVINKQTKYQRDCINKTNILVKFCDTSDDFDSFYTKISLYYGSCLEHIMDGIPEEHSSYMLTIKTMIEFLANHSKERSYSKSPNSSYYSDRDQSQSPKYKYKTSNYQYTDKKPYKKDYYQNKQPYVKHTNSSTKERSKSPSHDRRQQHSSKSPERSPKPRFDKSNTRSTSRDKSPKGATANIPSFSSKEFYVCQKCKNISIGSSKCSNCLFLCHFCKMGNHYIKNCRQYKYKEDLFKKIDNSTNHDESNIACISDTNNNITDSIKTPNEPEIPKNKRIKNLNKNNNCKIFNKLVKRTPEVFLNPQELDNFVIPKLKSSIRSTDPLNTRKKKISFNKVNKCVKYGSFWEPIKLSETSVEKKVYIKFNKKSYNVDYVIDINELKSKSVKFDVLNSLKNNIKNDAKILQNSLVNSNEIRQENLNIQETAHNTVNNKSDNAINMVSKGTTYTVSSINYSYLIHNPDKPVKSPVASEETVSVNFSNIIKNNNYNNLNFNDCLPKNNKTNKNSKSSIKNFKYSLDYNYNKFNNIVNEIDDYGKSSIYYNYKLFHLNSEKLIKFKFLFCQLNQFVNINYSNFNMYFNNNILNKNLNKIYKMVNLSINNNFNNFDIFNYNLSIFNLFNKNNLIYLYIALNYFNTYVFNHNNFNQMFLNILELNICNQIQVRLNNIVEGTGVNCKDHNCNQYTFGNPTKDSGSMEKNILNLLTRKQQELAINGIPRQNYWIMANKDKNPTRSANRPDILTFFISINNKPCKCLIDSGAQMSSMTKAGLKYFDIPCKELPPGKYNSLGMGGITPITHVAEANVVCHDLMFPKHSFKIINNSNPDYYVTLGSDWLQENKIIIDPFNLSIGCQIDKESYWELMCNCKLKLCRRILRNIPVYCYEGVTPREQYETLSNFNINLPDVKIIEQKNCLCNEPTMDKLNSFIYFSSTYNDVENSEKHNYKINIDENTGKIIDNMLIKDTMTNVHNSNFSVIKNLNANYCKLNRGTLVGTVSSPFCNVNDKNFPIRLNNNLLKRDIEIKNDNVINNKEASIRFNNFNDISYNDISDVNALKNLNNIVHYKYSNNANVHYDLMAPALGEESKADDPDLPDKSTWTKETLNSKLNIQSNNNDHVNKLQDLLFQYNDVFSQTDFSKEASLDPLTVELTDQIPIFIPQYKFQPDIEEAVQKKVNELIAQKQVVPSKSRYNFPILPIKKRTGTNTADNIRIVLDLRLLNKKAIKFDYPIPDISILLQKLGGFNLYTSLDFTNSFWQLPLDEKSQDYMSFSLARGKYKLTRAPQGFINTAAAFQSSMNYVFGDLLFNKELPVKTYVNGVPKWTNISRTRLISYIDDVIILAESEQVMELMLELVLKKLTEYQLKLKISKCIFSSIKLDFVGHEISKNRIRKQSKYVAKVLQVPRPE
ncbi:unnamed protein product, partial [Rotaria magnacalcarata]